MPTVNVVATMLDNTLKLIATAHVPCGGWGFSVSQKTTDGVLSVSVNLRPPPSGAIVSQGFTDLSMSETIDVPHGVTKVLVYGPPDAANNCEAVAEFTRSLVLRPFN